MTFGGTKLEQNNYLIVCFWSAESKKKKASFAISGELQDLKSPMSGPTRATVNHPKSQPIKINPRLYSIYGIYIMGVIQISAESNFTPKKLTFSW